jgi:hypothetical protein
VSEEETSVNERSPGRAWRKIGTIAGGAGALFTAVLVASSGTLVGCDSSETAVGGAKDPSKLRNTSIVHEPCDVKSKKVESLDANADGKPEVQRVYEGAREVCRVSDLNGDGKPNMYEYFEADGTTVRRREFDYDDNGVVNEIEVYKGGNLSYREMDTTNQGRIDTWDTFDIATGKISKRERDSSLDGRVDQWWVWNADGSVNVAVDRDGDGNPDPESSIAIGTNGQPVVDGGPAPKASSTADASLPPAPTAAPTPPAPTSAPSVPDAGATPTGPAKRGGAKR